MLLQQSLGKPKCTRTVTQTLSKKWHQSDFQYYFQSMYYVWNQIFFILVSSEKN